MRIRPSGGIIPEFRIIKEYWQMMTILGSIMFFVIYIYIENREYRTRVEVLIESNEKLKERINRLEGQLDVINQSIEIFLQNNPDVLKYRLEKLEKEIQHRGDRTQDFGILYDALQFRYTEKSQTDAKRVDTPFQKQQKTEITPKVISSDLENKSGFFKKMFKKKEK